MSAEETTGTACAAIPGQEGLNADKSNTPNAWASRWAQACVECKGKTYTEAKAILAIVNADAPLHGIPWEEAIEESKSFLRRTFPEETRAFIDADRLAVQDRLIDAPTLVDVLSAMLPPGERLTTGIPSLDRCLRGGLVPGRVYSLLGPPHRGKTALAVQVGIRLAREHRAIVLGLFPDEGDWQAAVMAAEGLGFDREDVENRFPSIRKEFSLRAGLLDFYLPDPSTTIEQAVATLDAADAGRPHVLIADSVQRVSCAGTSDAATAKERADVVMTALRKAAKALPPPIVLATSKANREAYKHTHAADNTLPIAAGLDSSSIEYDSDFMAFISGDPETGTTVAAVKNRPGDGTLPRIALRFDRARASFAEVDSESRRNADETRAAEEREARLSATMARVVETLRKHPGSSKRALLALVGGRWESLIAAMELLAKQDRICERNGVSYLAESDEG